MKLLTRYVTKKFLTFFLFSLIGSIVLFVVVDIIEQMDRFIDAGVPNKITLLYYLYFIPYVAVVIFPVATLLSTVFSIGTMAKNNETVAMKALGYSYYQVLSTLLILGVFLSFVSFGMAEGVVSKTNRKMEELKEVYMPTSKSRSKMRMRNVEIQEPPDKIVSIGTYDKKKHEARRVKIEQFDNNKLLSRVDSPKMTFIGGDWIITEGYIREKLDTEEVARPIDDTLRIHFQFTPEDLDLSGVKPEELGYSDLHRFITRIRLSGVNIERWMTELHVRFAFPFSCFFIVLLSVPVSYNRRKKSLAVGFGLSLLICFFYFGLIKTGQTLGYKGGVHPFFAAWLGNAVAAITGMVSLFYVRK